VDSCFGLKQSKLPPQFCVDLVLAYPGFRYSFFFPGSAIEQEHESSMVLELGWDFTFADLVLFKLFS
jgi:hypothetical protein